VHKACNKESWQVCALQHLNVAARCNLGMCSAHRALLVHC